SHNRPGPIDFASADLMQKNHAVVDSPSRRRFLVEADRAPRTLTSRRLVVACPDSWGISSHDSGRPSGGLFLSRRLRKRGCKPRCVLFFQTSPYDAAVSAATSCVSSVPASLRIC